MVCAENDEIKTVLTGYTLKEVTRKDFSTQISPILACNIIVSCLLKNLKPKI